MITVQCIQVKWHETEKIQKHLWACLSVAVERRTPLLLGSAPHVSSSVNCLLSCQVNYLSAAKVRCLTLFFINIAQQSGNQADFWEPSEGDPLSGEPRVLPGSYNKIWSDNNVSVPTCRTDHCRKAWLPVRTIKPKLSSLPLKINAMAYNVSQYVR